MGKGTSEKWGCAGDAQGGAGALEAEVRVSPELSGRDGDVSVQAVADGKISLQSYNGQVGEVMAYVGAINKLNPLGLPVRKPRV